MYPLELYLFCSVTDLSLQYGFITRHYSHYNGKGASTNSAPGGGGESVFFHMKSLAAGCDFYELHSGDEVEFLMVTNKSKKNSAIHVKKLR